AIDDGTDRANGRRRQGCLQCVGRCPDDRPIHGARDAETGLSKGRFQMTRRVLASIGLSAAMAFLMGSPMNGQSSAPPGKAARPYVAPKTPWGDPDLQGNYTNKYEQSTPFERPDEFAGRTIQDVKN